MKGCMTRKVLVRRASATKSKQWNTGVTRQHALPFYPPLNITALLWTYLQTNRKETGKPTKQKTVLYISRILWEVNLNQRESERKKDLVPMSPTSLSLPGTPGTGTTWVCEHTPEPLSIRVRYHREPCRRVLKEAQKETDSTPRDRACCVGTNGNRCWVDDSTHAHCTRTHTLWRMSGVCREMPIISNCPQAAFADCKATQVRTHAPPSHTHTHTPTLI